MKKVLIIDDSQEIQTLVHKILSKDFEVKSVLEVNENIFELIEEFGPDLILLDIVMPNISGIELCQEIKSSHLASIPVVMMTALTDKDSIQKAFDAKADDFLTKPLDINLLPYRVKFNIQQRLNLSEVSLRKKTLSRINDAARIKYWLKDVKLLKSPGAFALQTMKSYYYGLKFDEMSLESRDHLIAEKVGAFQKLLTHGTQHLKYTLSDSDKRFTFIETISLVDGQVLGIIQDVSNATADQNELHGLAYFDERTGLANGNSFRKNCKLAMMLAKRQNSSLALVTLRLVNLKEVSEFVGAGFYFKVIHYFRNSLPGIIGLSENDIYLTAEDEIRFLLHEGDEEKVQQTANEIIEFMKGKFNFKDKNYTIDLSFGVSLYPKDGEDMDKLITHSQLASHDHPGTIFYRDSYREAMAKKLAIKTEVAEALVKQEFECYFQPQMNLDTYHITGAELLLRWHHPTRGFTYPGYFIEETESNGQIVDIGFWNLRKTFEYCERWNKLGHKLKLSMNLSAKQVTKDMIFVKTMESLLKEFNISPSLVGVEITETSLLEDFELTRDFLGQLKDLGIRISLDDFGTGFSSLKYLKDLPIDCIKIDRHFVMNIKTDQFSRAFVSCITTLAKNLGMDVIAEAVETKEDAEILRSLGCQSIQGYSMPVSEGDFLKLVAEFNQGPQKKI
jgi:EAL domain-containing protein (putative c-di-GMP-specific phosphodiesterase class I)/PleD family two-component response regulator